MLATLRLCHRLGSERSGEANAPLFLSTEALRFGSGCGGNGGCSLVLRNIALHGRLDLLVASEDRSAECRDEEHDEDYGRPASQQQCPPVLADVRSDEILFWQVAQWRG